MRGVQERGVSLAPKPVLCRAGPSERPWLTTSSRHLSLSRACSPRTDRPEDVRYGPRAHLRPSPTADQADLVMAVTASSAERLYRHSSTSSSESQWVQYGADQFPTVYAQSAKNCSIPQPDGYSAWPAVPEEKQLPMSMQSPAPNTGKLTDVGQFSGWPTGCECQLNQLALTVRGLTSRTTLSQAPTSTSTPREANHPTHSPSQTRTPHHATTRTTHPRSGGRSTW